MLQGRDLDLQVVDGLLEGTDGGLVEVPVDGEDLSIEGVDLCLVAVLLGTSGIDGGLDVFSLGLEGMGIGLKLCFSLVDGIDFVVQGNIVGVEEIDLLGEGCDFFILDQNSGLKSLLVDSSSSKLLFKADNEGFSCSQGGGVNSNLILGLSSLVGQVLD